MIVRHNAIFALLALSGLVTASHAHFPQYCAECEQEIWEQVPCSDLSTTTTRTPTTTGSTPALSTTTQSPTTSTTRLPTTSRVPPTWPSTWPPTLPPITTRAPVYTTSQTPYTPYITTPSTYKKCYCECKLGCKEFCRKVSVASPKQQISQISSTGDYAPGGQIEYTHSHQRKYFPKYVAPSKNYKPYPLAYGEAAVAASAPAPNNINAPNYTLEELAHLLSSAYGSRKGYPASPQQQQQQQSTVYYPAQPLVSQLQPEYKQPEYKQPEYKQPEYKQPEYKQPEYKQPEYKQPAYSNVAAPMPEERVTIKIAAAAVASSGRAMAKAKTPYKEIVATSAPIYESTTSYPIPPPEPPKSYPDSVPEPLPLPMPQTEAYPTQTEAYPDKSYEAPESNSIKPESSSSFDLAIDNYLKDFGYGNQVRDLDY